jgi:hypothetical protein
MQEWCATRTCFTDLADVKRLLAEAASDGISPQFRLWNEFFRFQAAYLLQWTIIERYSALGFGPLTRAGQESGESGRRRVLRSDWLGPTVYQHARLCIYACRPQGVQESSDAVELSREAREAGSG